jgi:uncharacterized NAD(P)/FAD-binding protein YdhS
MEYDIVLLGSGISSTQTLLQLLQKIEKKPFGDEKIKIGVIEKTGEFFTGIPYGKRSSVNSLTITTFGEFIHPAEKQDFLQWLESSETDWMERVNSEGGEAAGKWFSHNKPHIEQKNWDEIYIPRFLYGLFLCGKIKEALAKTGGDGKATVDLIQAEAIDVSLKPGASYEVTIEFPGGETQSLNAKRLIIAIGSGTIKPVPPPENNGVIDSGYYYINDTYHPSLATNLDSIGSLMAAEEEINNRNLLIIGSNASSLELLYLIKQNPNLEKSLNKAVVISFSGMLPHRITENNHPDYHFANLEELKKQEKYSSTDLIHIIEKDLDIAFEKGVHIGDMYYQLSDLVVELLKKLGIDQEKDFYSRYGNRFTKLIRRAGAEYRDAAQELIDTNKLELIRGSFISLIKPESHAQGVLLHYLDTGENKKQTSPHLFPIVINCGGFEDLDASSSRLINSLVSKQICMINRTNRGFEVTENFEANKNLYVMGPLLGGIFNNRVKYWHVENAKRVRTLSALLAEAIAESLNCP